MAGLFYQTGLIGFLFIPAVQAAQPIPGWMVVPMFSPIIAALDLGSNTFRLMLAEKKAESHENYYGSGKLSAQAKSEVSWAGKRVFQHIPRLSERLTSGGNFAPEALERAWAALEEFDELIKSAGAQKVLAGATMAARLAADGPDFMAEISRRFGWETAILSGDEEARLTASGVLSALAPLPEQGLIFDIGGRSTEFISTSTQKIIKSRSLAMGVVELTEAHLSDPPKPGELRAVSEAVKKILAEADFSDIGPGAELVGTAGTVTTVASLLLGLKVYDPGLVNNSRLARGSIAELLKTLAQLPLNRRIEQYALHPRRADAIVSGLVIVLEIMDHFERQEILVSDNGLLEGLWLRAVGI